jgi:hypothetical protein
MRDDRLLRILRPALALVALAAMLVVLGLAITGPAQATTKSPTPTDSKSAKASGKVKEGAAQQDGYKVQRGAEVRGGDDVIVLKGTNVPSVVAFGGDVKVDGTVEQTVVAFGGDVVINGKVGESVVAFGGDVTINGTVDASTVAFGGDVRLTRNANVGRDVRASDAAVVVAGGDLKRVPGARVHGQIKHSAGRVDIGHLIDISARGMLFNPLLGLSFGGWVAQTVFFLVLALVAAALMPKQMLRVETQLRRRPWASLGWGALAFFLAIPVIFIAVGITIIGLLLWLPFGLFVLFLYFFGVTALAALLAQKVLSGFGGKENLVLAVVLGVVGTTIVSRIPVVGVLALLVMTVIGTGAVILAVAERRREIREAEAARIAAQAAAAPQYAAPAATGSVITPIVQTSPAQQSQPQAQPPQSPPQPAVPATPPQPPGLGQQPPAGPVPPVAPVAPQEQAVPEPPSADTAGGAGPEDGGRQPGDPAT